MSIFDKKVKRDEKFCSMQFDSEEAKRDAEEQLLKPENIESYSGELPKYSNELESRTALIVFRDKAQMELIGEIFSIRESCNGKTYITNIQLLEGLAKLVKDGIMRVIGDSLHLIPTEESVVAFDPTIEQDLIHELFYYENGFLYWKVDKGKMKAGSKAGSIPESGYCTIRVNGTTYYTHRLIWIYFNGPIPLGMWVDHDDGDKQNNFKENLKLKTPSDNHKNMCMRSDNTSGTTGVHFQTCRNRWEAIIHDNGKKVYLGRYLTKEEAVQAREEARVQYGYTDRHGTLPSDKSIAKEVKAGSMQIVGNNVSINSAFLATLEEGTIDEPVNVQEEEGPPEEVVAAEPVLRRRSVFDRD